MVLYPSTIRFIFLKTFHYISGKLLMFRISIHSFIDRWSLFQEHAKWETINNKFFLHPSFASLLHLELEHLQGTSRFDRRVIHLFALAVRVPASSAATVGEIALICSVPLDDLAPSLKVPFVKRSYKYLLFFVVFVAFLPSCQRSALQMNKHQNYHYTQKTLERIQLIKCFMKV